MKTRLVVAADHGGFVLKARLVPWLEQLECEILDEGAYIFDASDDYPDYAEEVAEALNTDKAVKGILICGSGVGACIVSNKIPGVRAALITDCFSAHQGVEDDDMNVMCLGAMVTGPALSWDLVKTFLNARYVGVERYRRRLEKVAALEIEIDSRRIASPSN